MIRTSRRHRAGRPAVLAVLAAVSGLGGCGGASTAPGQTAPRRPVPVTVALDFTPNPAHAPLFLAVRDGFDRRLGVRLTIRPPASGPNSLELLLGGRADLAVLDINDLGLARLKGADLVGVAALVQRPLGALIVQPRIRRPRDLVGTRVGVSGLPSDPAFLRAVLARDGAHLSQVRQVVIGFAAVSQMLAGNISGVPAFWSDEGVTLRRRGLAVREFRIDDYGAPRFPEVVLAVRRETLRRHRDVVIRALAAIALGAQAAVRDPHAAAAVIDAAAPGDPGLTLAQTLALRAALAPALRLDRAVLAAWAAFDARVGFLPGRIDIARTFDLTVAPDALRRTRR